MIMQKLFTPLLLPFLTVAALAVLFLCGGCSKEQVSKRESLRWTEMGETALKADDWNEAVRCYTEALAAATRLKVAGSTQPLGSSTFGAVFAAAAWLMRR